MFACILSFVLHYLAAVIDIADENGSLKTIYERPPDQYASQYLQGRANFVLLKVLSKFSFFVFLCFSLFKSLVYIDKTCFQINLF